MSNEYKDYMFDLLTEDEKIEINKRDEDYFNLIKKWIKEDQNERCKSIQHNNEYRNIV